MNLRAFWQHKERRREATPQPNAASLHSRAAKIRRRRSVFASCLHVKSEVSHSPFSSVDYVARLPLRIQRLPVCYLHQSLCPHLRFAFAYLEKILITSRGGNRFIDSALKYVRQVCCYQWRCAEVKIRSAAHSCKAKRRPTGCQRKFDSLARSRM